MRDAVTRLRSSIATASAGLTERLPWNRRSESKRALVHEILSIQVLSAALIGCLAIASLYWGGQWVLQDNYARWAQQWTGELNELAAPLYLTDDTEARLRLDSFVDRYPEIAHVSYFDRDGLAMFTVEDFAEAGAAAGLTHEHLAPGGFPRGMHIFRHA